MNQNSSSSSPTSLSLSLHPPHYWQSLLESAVQADDANSHNFLLAFKHSARPYETCLHILSSSTHPHVLYHTLSTLVTAVERDFTLLSADHLDEITSAANRLSIQQIRAHHVLSALVSRQCAFLIAYVTKRRASVMEDDTFLLRLLDSYVSVAADDVAVLVDHCQKITTITTEFAQIKAAIGMTVDDCIRLHHLFESRCIAHLSSKVASAIQTSLNNQRANAELLSTYLSVIDSLLSWDYDSELSESERLRQAFAQTDKSVHLRPGAAFTDTFIHSPLVNILLSVGEWLFTNMRVSAPHTNAIHLLYHCFLQLAKFRGRIFTNSELQQQFAIQMMTSLIKLFSIAGAEPSHLSSQSSPSSSVSSPYGILTLSDMFDIAKIVDQLMGIIDAKVITSQFGSRFIYVLWTATEWIIGPKRMGSLSDSVDTRARETLDVLLNAWVQLVTTATENASIIPTPLWEALAKSSHQVVALYIGERLERAEHKSAVHAVQHEHDNDDDGDDSDEQFVGSLHEDEQLASVAALARMHAAPVLSSLTNLIRQRLTHWTNTMTTSAASSSSTYLLFEQLTFLYRMLGHVLTDDYQGESVIIPSQILQLSSLDSSNDIIDDAFQTVLLYLTTEHICLTSSSSIYSKSLLSPLLSEVVMWMLQRWIAAYILPDVTLYNTFNQSLLLSSRLFKKYGIINNNNNNLLNNEHPMIIILTIILQSLIEHILLWNEEETIIIKSIDLLHLLLYTHPQVYIYRSIIILSSPWQRLLYAYQQLATHDPYEQQQQQQQQFSDVNAIINLTSTALMKLIIVILHSSILIPNTNDHHNNNSIEINILNQFNNIINPINQRFNIIISNNLFLKNYQQSRIVYSLLPTLYMMRGIIQSSSIYTFNGIFLLFYNNNNNDNNLNKYLYQLLELYSSINHRLIIQQILYIISDLAEYNLIYMNTQQSYLFMSNALNYVKYYVNIYQKHYSSYFNTLSANKQLVEYSLITDDQQSDLLALLSLLHHMSSKDIYDKSIESTIDFASQACMTGLLMLLPIMNETFFDCPVISEAACLLLMECVTSQQDRIAKQSDEERNAILSAIAVCLKMTGDQHALRYGLQCVGGIGNWHITHRQESPFAAFCLAMISRVLELILIERTPMELVELLADTLMTLIIAQPQHYAEIAQSIIQQWRDNKQQGSIAHVMSASHQADVTRLISGFESLMSAAATAALAQLSGGSVNGKILNANRMAKINFRRNLRAFIQNVRTIM